MSTWSNMTPSKSPALMLSSISSPLISTSASSPLTVAPPLWLPEKERASLGESERLSAVDCPSVGLTAAWFSKSGALWSAPPFALIAGRSEPTFVSAPLLVDILLEGAGGEEGVAHVGPDLVHPLLVRLPWISGQSEALVVQQEAEFVVEVGHLGNAELVIGRVHVPIHLPQLALQPELAKLAL
eukprot:CAMPEP_0168612064 /NCGR_PEP_ID=MMETSP0449_2-20121227/2705_1 /TAXON_ID=1082188 /ORGANISM="Strombidium rassoulzadegani, Strain ras09" /LENGTH=183 /DNA_ID=CAMNT_0008652579 /DNA_START=251 /DNA_END=804 /DNA_ORIENTATION=+